MLENNEISKYSDEELVGKSLENSNNFKFLIERYENKFGQYIRRRAKVSNEDIEDILQDVFIKIYLNLRDFDTSLKFSSWGYRIAHNELISWYRKKSIRPQINFEDYEEENILNFLTDDTNVFKKAVDSEFKEKFDQALNSLGDKYKEMLTLRLVEEKDYTEISDILQIPIGTVSTQIYRGKKELQKLLEKYV